MSFFFTFSYSSSYLSLSFSSFSSCSCFLLPLVFIHSSYLSFFTFPSFFSSFPSPPTSVTQDVLPSPWRTKRRKRCTPSLLWWRRLKLPTQFTTVPVEDPVQQPPPCLHKTCTSFDCIRNSWLPGPLNKWSECERPLKRSAELSHPLQVNLLPGTTPLALTPLINHHSWSLSLLFSHPFCDLSYISFFPPSTVSFSSFCFLSFWLISFFFLRRRVVVVNFIGRGKEREVIEKGECGYSEEKRK